MAVLWFSLITFLSDLYVLFLNSTHVVGRDYCSYSVSFLPSSLPASLLCQRFVKYRSLLYGVCKFTRNTNFADVPLPRSSEGSFGVWSKDTFFCLISILLRFYCRIHYLDRHIISLVSFYWLQFRMLRWLTCLFCPLAVLYRPWNDPGPEMIPTEPRNDPQTGPEMIPKLALKWSPNWPWNDPGPETIPRSDRRWTLNLFCHI